MNKLSLLLLFVLGFCLKSAAQAISIPTDQYHLYGPNSTWNEYLQIGGNGQATNFAFVATTNGNLHLDAKPGGFATYINHYNQGPTYINPQGGNVGVGTFSPSEKLEVNGNLRSDRLRVGNAVFQPNSRSSFNSFNTGLDPGLTIGWIASDFGGSDNSSDRLVIGTGFGGRVVLGTHSHDLTSWGGDLLISPTGGNVGIGTTIAREKLSVNGKIRAHEIKVETANWPDYVFDQDYKVLGLQELDAYIKANKHLPEMPSAKEVEANGMALGELVKLQQKKIEELTLHLIEKDKDFKKLELQQSELEKKVEWLMKK